MQQIVHIHGGMTFKCKKDYVHYLKTHSIKIETKICWADTLKTLKGVQVIRPRIPLQDFAKYDE